MKKLIGIILTLMLITTGALAAVPEIKQFTYTPSPAVPGTTITILVQLQNNESTPQKGVTLKIENEYPFTVKASDSEPNPRIVGEIEKYSKALATFKVYVDPTAQNQTYQIPLIITTSESNIGKKTYAQILVSGKEPVLKVISVKDASILPGEQKDITLTLQNIGTSTAYDIIAEIQEDRTITAAGAIIEREITAVGAATAYLPEINPGERKNITLRISATNTAMVKNYSLPIKISYRTTAGNRTTDTSYIGINVIGTAQFDATIKEKPVGTKGELTIEIFNKGLGKAEFTLVEVKEINAKIEKPRQFIGTMGPNDVDTIKTPISFNTTGEQTIQVTIEYKDTDSKIKNTTITIPITVNTQTENEPAPTLTVIAIIIIAAVVWRFGLKKKKK